nr:uncharacterized protein LOC127332655 [Lolium perenne]
MVLLIDINSTPPEEDDDVGRVLDLNFSPHTPQEQEQAAQPGHIPDEQEQEQAAELEQNPEQEQEERNLQRRRKDVPERSKFASYIALKALGKDRPVVKADKENVAQLLGISLRSVEKTWKKAMDQEARNEVVDFSNNWKMCGRKRRELNLDERVPQVPLNQRGTLRALASSIQSLAFESAPNTLKELIESVEQAYDAYDVNTLAKVYVTLQSVLVKIMKNQGGNAYKIKEGNLPDTLEVDSELYEETLKLIEEYEMQLKEEEIKATQSKKASKIKGRSQLIVDDDLVITGKEYGTWLEDSSSIKKLDLIRERQVSEFEVAIQEEKPEEEKWKGKTNNTREA